MSSYQDFISHLADREYFGQKLGLERMQEAVRLLKHPERSFPSLHIAGTNGKGSTAAMLASVLEEAGYRVGLYTSPHLEDFRERIRIGDELISEGDVLGLARRIEETCGTDFTFFELTTLLAFLYFSQKKVDVAVIEVGLGGRLDATNVITPLVSIITSIGHDHQQHLGSTLAAIAREKAGIVKPGVPVLVGAETDVPQDALQAIRETAERNVPTSEITFPETLPAGVKLVLEGEHQRRNAGLVLAALRLLGERHSFAVSQEAVERGLNLASWPGRLETVSTRPWILLDGAHNPEAMRVVHDYLKPRLQGRKLHVVFAAMADKDYGATLREILPITDELWLTCANLERSETPERLSESLGKDFKSWKVFPDVRSVYEAVREIPEDAVLLVTGSFFLVGEFRSLYYPTQPRS